MPPPQVHRLAERVFANLVANHLAEGRGVPSEATVQRLVDLAYAAARAFHDLNPTP